MSRRSDDEDVLRLTTSLPRCATDTKSPSDAELLGEITDV
jgi:hypothetical protein